MTPEQPETLRVALEVVEVFAELGIEYHLGGSYASSIHGIPRQTQDIDFVVDLDEASVIMLLDRLPDDYYRDAEAAGEAVRSRASFNVIHLGSGVKIDLFVAGAEPYDRVELSRSCEVRLPSAPDRRLRVKSAEDTILRKLQWFRLGGETSERQWDDVLGVMQSQGPDLDFDYLELWAKRLGIEDLLDQARGT